MLGADELEKLGSQAERLIAPVTDWLIEDAARRIAEAGKMTATAQYQLWRAQGLGISGKEWKKRLRKLLNTSREELEALLTGAARGSYAQDTLRFPDDRPFAQNEEVQRIVSAAAQTAGEDLRNLTQTMGFVTANGTAVGLSDAYRQSCDYAFLKVSTGAQDYASAIREATRGLAEKGIVTIDYESGVHTSLEAAVRRSVLGGLGLMQEQISRQMHDELGCDGWEISAHMASAPDHEPIQGKQYSDAEFEKLNNSLVRRIGTLNCGHAASPIRMGIDAPQYTAEELEEMRRSNEKGIDYEGRHFTRYEATQRQRQLERNIRKQKRKILIDEATGDKERLPVDQTRYVVLEDEYKRFSKATGQRVQYERTELPGFGAKQANAAKRDTNAAYQDRLKAIGAENTQLQTLEKRADAQYNQTQEYQLLSGYEKAVEKGDISPLVGFDLYQRTSESISSALVGQTTATGVELKSFSTHFIDRIIGQTSDAHPGMRQGVPIADALDALQNPVRIGEVRHLADGDTRQTFYGERASVVISIRDGRAIQTNPRHGGK